MNAAVGFRFRLAALAALLVLVAAPALAGPSPAAAGAPEGFTFVKELGGIREYTFAANGLRVLTLPDRSAPVVTFMVTYLVGSRNEAVGHTGATHLLEHLMFKGTPTFNKAAGSQIAAVLKNVGAYYNATTWFDRTNYFELLPRGELELAVRLEADRMRNSFIRDDDRRPEMTVVRNEFERLENEPSAVMEDRLFALAYLAHPYHHSTIGWRSDIEGVSTERLREFYDTFYHPNNAVAVVIGDFDEGQALGLIRKYFGAYGPAPKPIPAVYTTEPPQQGERRFALRRAGELGLVLVGQKVPAATHADTPALGVLAAILADGRMSRLYRALVDQNLAVDVSAGAYALRDPSLLIVQALLAPDVAHAQVEDIVVKAFEQLAAEPVSAEELQRVKEQMRAATAFARDGSFAVAAQLNEAIAAADWTLFVSALARVEAVTAADVQRVARQYLGRDDRTVGHFVPLPATVGGASDPAAGGPADFAAGPLHALPPGPPEVAPAGASGLGGNAQGGGSSGAAGPAFEKSIRVTSTGPGARLLTLKTGVADVVSFRGSLVAGDASSPPESPMLADLTGNMLDRGTQRHDKFALAEALERVGVDLSIAVGTFHTEFGGRCLKRDLPLVLELLAEMLRTPRFDAGELTKLQKERAAILRRQLDHTGARAANELSRLVFPPGHPFRTPPVSELIASVERLTVDDLRQFHARTYGGRSLRLVLVGDVDEAGAAKLFRKHFGDWKGGVAFPDVARLQPAAKGDTRVVTLADKANVDIRIGQAVGLRLSDADYLAFQLANRVLGASTIASRIGLRLRDTEGLTYGVTTDLTTSNLADGAFSVSLSVAPENIGRALTAFREELDRFLSGGVTVDEFENEKRSMTGRFEVTLGFDSGALAQQILAVEEEGLGLGYLDGYAARVRALTLDQVNAAARRYLLPDRLHMALSGSIDEAQKPLAPKP